MKKLITSLASILFILTLSIPTILAQEFEGETLEAESTVSDFSYLQAVIDAEENAESKKSIIFDASKSFISDQEAEARYFWEFGDGNSNEGIEVLHAYQEPGNYTVTLTIENGENTSITEKKLFVYEKLLVLVTDQTEDKDRIEIIKEFAEKNNVYIQVIESFGSSTEFISEEILTKKLTESTSLIEKTNQIVIWTKENAGLNAISRFIQNNRGNRGNYFSEKSLIIIAQDISQTTKRIERQIEIINPSQAIVIKEGGVDALIETKETSEFLNTIEERGDIFQQISSSGTQVRPWNFMSYFVNLLIDNGIPDNTIALLLLLPVIATVVAVMRQVVGVTTFGIYTPSIITLSFLIIGMHAGLLTLISAILIGSLARPILKKIRMLFIPKMAIVFTVVSLNLLLILILSLYLELFDSTYLSTAIFPMLILSTLVEKFVSAKTDKSLSSAAFLMGETLLVSVIAYFIAGGEINLGFTSFKFDFVKNLMLTYPEIIFLLIIGNVFLGKWSGLRVLERIRFREILRHIEE